MLRRRITKLLGPIDAMALGIALCWPLASSAIAAPAKADLSTLQTVADYALPGNTTRWDYMSLDAPRSQLFIAHLGDSSVVVFNTKTKAVVASIDKVGSVHGMIAIPELNRIYASATKTDEIVAIDATTLKITARIPGGVYPDGMAYAPEAHKLYVSDEHGKTETVIDVQTNRRIATILLGGEVGNTQYDTVSKHIFVNVQTTGELIEIDPKTDTVIRRMPLAGADGNHGLYIDAASRRAFIVCEGNDKLIVFDLASHRVLSTFDVGGGPDVLAFDPGPGWLYVAGEAGIVSLFQVEPDKVSKLAEGFLGPNAHVVAVDPASHLAYFPLKDVGGHSVLRVTAPRKK